MVQHFVLINFSKGLCCKTLGRSVDAISYQGMHVSDIMELLENGGDWKGDRLAIVGEYADDDIAGKLVIPGLVQSFKSGKKRASTTPLDPVELDKEASKVELELKSLLKEDGSPFEFLKKRMKGIKVHAPAIYFDEGKYLLNHTKKQFIPRSKFRAPLGAALNAMISCIQDKVGKWSGDSISITNDIENYKHYTDATELAERTYIQLSKENHNEDHHQYDF